MSEGKADLGWWGKHRHMGTPHVSPITFTTLRVLHMMLLSNIIKIIDNMYDPKANRVLASLIEHAVDAQHVQNAISARSAGNRNTRYFVAPSWRNLKTKLSKNCKG
jgi:hypothetical protein